jgi:hypothetical protein
MTLIVNRFLKAVNNIAIRYGGDLLKFAGDASISFYQGKGHAARACRAAWEMQQAMREQFACVRTSLGEFPLRMSIGVGSGQVFIANLGTPANAECAAMGPALANMGHAEHLAKAGQMSASKGAFFEPEPASYDTFLPQILKGHTNENLDSRVERNAGRTAIASAPLLQLPMSLAGSDFPSNHRRRRGDIAGGGPGEPG